MRRVTNASIYPNLDHGDSTDSNPNQLNTNLINPDHFILTMTKKQKKKSITQLAKEILGQLHEIDQKIEHLIRRLPKNGHHLYDSQWNYSGG